MLEFEEFELEENIEFEEAESMEEVKKTLRSGYGIFLSEDKCKGLYFSEDHIKLYLFECQDEGENLTTIENYEMMGKEIDVEEADKLIEEYLNVVKQEEDRREKYNNWLSK